MPEDNPLAPLKTPLYINSYQLLTMVPKIFYEGQLIKPGWLLQQFLDFLRPVQIKDGFI